MHDCYFDTRYISLVICDRGVPNGYSRHDDDVKHSQRHDTTSADFDVTVIIWNYVIP